MAQPQRGPRRRQRVPRDGRRARARARGLRPRDRRALGDRRALLARRRAAARGRRRLRGGDPARRARARRGQARAPGRAAAQGRSARRGRVGARARAPRGRRAHRRAACPRATRCSRSCATTTSAWTARGYPHGLRGSEIPAAARIVGACDAYAAMTQHRPYRASLTPDDAIAELRRNADAQFDAEVVTALVCVLDSRDDDYRLARTRELLRRAPARRARRARGSAAARCCS